MKEDVLFMREMHQESGTIGSEYAPYRPRNVRKAAKESENINGTISYVLTKFIIAAVMLVIIIVSSNLPNNAVANGIVSAAKYCVSASISIKETASNFAKIGDYIYCKLFNVSKKLPKKPVSTFTPPKNSLPVVSPQKSLTALG